MDSHRRSSSNIADAEKIILLWPITGLCSQTFTLFECDAQMSNHDFLCVLTVPVCVYDGDGLPLGTASGDVFSADSKGNGF